MTMDERSTLAVDRRIGEEIIIGTGEGAVSVMLVRIRGNKARLCVKAPRSVAVHRREVYEQEYPFAGDPAKVVAAKVRAEMNGRRKPLPTG